MFFSRANRVQLTTKLKIIFYSIKQLIRKKKIKVLHILLSVDILKKNKTLYFFSKSNYLILNGYSESWLGER